MLKQSPSRNQRSKGFKVKHAIKMFVGLTICFWILFRIKQSWDERVSQEENNPQFESPEGINGENILKLGRKGLNPQLDDEVAESGKHEDEEGKVGENKEGARDEEMDSDNLEKTEEGEHEQLEDLIDEEDKEE